MRGCTSRAAPTARKWPRFGCITLDHEIANRACHCSSDDYPFRIFGTSNRLLRPLRNPEKYNGKEVTVRATWSKGPEWSALYCLGCPDKSSVWLDVRTELDDASKKALRQVPMPATANLTVQGVFMSGGLYGHRNQYQYQLVARKVNDAANCLERRAFHGRGKRGCQTVGLRRGDPKLIEFKSYYSKRRNRTCGFRRPLVRISSG